MTATAAKVVKSTTIEVDFTKPPAEGKKQASVKAKDGRWWGIFPDKLGLLRPGHAYQIEFSEREWNGRTYYTITKCKPAQSAMAPIEQERSSRPAPSIDAPLDQEHEFVTRLLASAVKTGCIVGKTEDDYVRHAQMLRAVYRRVFG